MMKTLFSILMLLATSVAIGQTSPEFNRCVSDAISTAEDNLTIGELRSHCREVALTVPELEQPAHLSALKQRMRSEQQEEWNAFVLLPHKPNYLMLSHNLFDPNEAPFVLANPDKKTGLQPLETKFQLSLKLPIIQGLFRGHGALYAGYTNRSFWQMFNKEDSSPFRETNHEPEAWLSFKTDFNVLGLHNSVIRTGFSHQSNGQSGSLSRSWNRIYADFILERGNAYFSFKPWFRIPEKSADDDNEDITDYMGNFELRSLYKFKSHNFDMMLRHGFGESKTSFQLGWSFPINKRVRGYAQWFNGYGESLIDYDSRSNSIGVGLLLSDWL